MKALSRVLWSTYVGVCPAGGVVRDGDQVLSVLQRAGLDRRPDVGVGVGGRLQQTWNQCLTMYGIMIGGFKDLCYNTTKPIISEGFADKLELAFQILCIRDSIDVKIEEPHL